MNISDVFNNSQSSKKYVKTLLNDDILNQTKEWFERYSKIMAYYRCAMMEIETKFNVLNEEFSLQLDRNPINGIKTRIKNPLSLKEKLERKKKRLEMYYKAEEAILGGAQSYSLGSRNLTRANLSEIRKI